MRFDAKEVLGSYIDALYPIVYINHFDFKTVDELIMNFSTERKIVEFVEGNARKPFPMNILYTY